MKTRLLVPSCSMRTGGRTDGQTGMTMLIGAFHNFEKASKSVSLHRWVEKFKIALYIEHSLDLIY